MAGNSQIIVGGYAFYNTADAQLAELERKKIEYLKTHLGNSDPEKVLSVYEKAINERIFKTPIGMDFLKEMQVYLIETCDYSPEEIPSIPVYVEYEKRLREDYVTAKPKIKRTEKKEKVPFIYISVVFNIALIAAVVAMFLITLNSDNPNILNYETNLVNKYSYWEQELNEKQQELRIKERDLKEWEEELSEAAKANAAGN